MAIAAQNEFTEAWLVEAIDLISFCIVKDGPVYAPILERLEHELESVRRKDDVVARARRNVELRNKRLANDDSLSSATA